MICKSEFMRYEKVRASGVTNMFMIQTVCDLTGLDRKVVLELMKTYDYWHKKYMPDEEK